MDGIDDQNQTPKKAESEKSEKKNVVGSAPPGQAPMSDQVHTGKTESSRIFKSFARSLHSMEIDDESGYRGTTAVTVEHPITQQEAVWKELEGLFGKENMGQARKSKNSTMNQQVLKDFEFSKRLKTKDGAIKLGVHYSADSNYFYIRPDPQVPLTTMSLRLNKQGLPQRADLIDDNTKFFARLFNDLELKALAKDLRAVLAGDKIKKITEQYDGKPGGYVMPGTFRTTPLDNAIATTGLYTCSGLVVIDKGRQYLGHITPTTSPEMIRKSLRDFDIENAEIYVLKGSSGDGTAKSMLDSLSDKPGALKNLKYLFTTQHDMFPSLVVHDGKLYYVPDEINTWSKGGISLVTGF